MEYVLLCGYDGNNMYLEHRKYQCVYKCNKYKRKYRKYKEPVCVNQITWQDSEYLREYIAYLEENDLLKDGYTDKVGDIQIEIGESNEDTTYVYIKANKGR